MNEDDRAAFRRIIVNPGLTAGLIAEALRVDGYLMVDRAAVGHFRRKLQAGKATL